MAAAQVTRQPTPALPQRVLPVHHPALPWKNNFIQILEEHPVNQNTAGCQRNLSRAVLSHTMAVPILLLHSLDRDINKKRKRAITMTKSLTAEGEWHVNSSSGRVKLAGNNCAPALYHSQHLKSTSLLCGFVCCGAGHILLTWVLRHSSQVPHL